MKTILTIVFTLLMCMQVISQTNLNPYNKYQSSEDFNPTQAYLSFSTGINNMVGLLGASLDLIVNQNLTVGTGIGLSTWGYKWEVNMQYYPKGWHGFYMKGGYSRNSGLEQFESEMELYGGSTDYVMMDLEPMGNVFITAGYAWKVGKCGKYYLEGGYAVPLITDDYYNLYDDNVKLSSTSEQVLKILRPGGLVIATGICIAL